LNDFGKCSDGDTANDTKPTCASEKVGCPGGVNNGGNSGHSGNNNPDNLPGYDCPSRQLVCSSSMQRICKENIAAWNPNTKLCEDREKNPKGKPICDTSEFVCGEKPDDATNPNGGNSGNNNATNHPQYDCPASELICK
jgi:hypothetical protein